MSSSLSLFFSSSFFIWAPNDIWFYFHCSKHEPGIHRARAITTDREKRMRQAGGQGSQHPDSPEGTPSSPCPFKWLFCISTGWLEMSSMGSLERGDLASQTSWGCRIRKGRLEKEEVFDFWGIAWTSSFGSKVSLAGVWISGTKTK